MNHTHTTHILAEGRPSSVAVVGGGLVGALLSILLARRGYPVTLYERRPDMRTAPIEGGRSINLAMSHRGWKGLERAGVFDQLRNQAIPMYGRMMHDTTGQLTYQPYGKAGEAIYSVSRGGLNQALIRLADQLPNIELHFDTRCDAFDLSSGELTLVHTTHGTRTVTRPDLIFATDGAYSAVRDSLMKRPLFNYSQQYLPHGYKELTILPEQGSTLERHALHIWPRGNFMLIALPNPDHSFTCTLFMPFDGEDHSFAALQTPQQVRAFFEQHFPDTLPLIPHLESEFAQKPTGSLVTVSCSPWRYRNTLLLGDAAHAIVPFYGQGMNAGFEDCTLLDDLLDQLGDTNWEQVLDTFNRTRIPDANAIAALAHRNFIEMRDLVGDPRFLLRKKMEAYLHEHYPDRFIPVYSMVTFSHLPYSQAWAETTRQDALFEQILALPDLGQHWADDPRFHRLFEQAYPPVNSFA